MKKSMLLPLAMSLVLVGCTGPGEMFESRTYGVRNSEWSMLNTSERYAAKQAYLQEQALAEQRRLNDILRAQNEEMQRARYDSARYHTHHHHNHNHAQDLQQQQRAAERQRQAAADQQRIYRSIARQNHRPEPTQRQPSSEDVAIAEAKRQSLITHQQEEARRQQLRAQEQRDIAEATRRSMETYNAEQAARNQASQGTHNDWQPNEGQIVRAGELVMSLQRELGRQPSASEMNTKLQSSMGLSRAQSAKVIDELGLY